MSVVQLSTTEPSALGQSPTVVRQDLQRRPRRLEAELAAFCELSCLLTDEPERAIPRFLELAMNLCEADAALVSVLQIAQQQTICRWQAVGGTLGRYQGHEMPKELTLCGMCIDSGKPIFLSHPGQQFPSLSRMKPVIAETLVLPLYDSSERPVGTVWLVRHDSRPFSEADVQVLEQLSIQLMLALKLSYAETKHRELIALTNSETEVRKELAQALIEERSRGKQAETTNKELQELLTFKDACILEMDHRAKNTLQVAANFLVLQSRTTASAEARIALQEGYRRIHVLARFHEQLCMSGQTGKRFHMPKLLQDLGDALETAFTEMSKRVKLKLTSDWVWIDEQDAVPLALLANELITNAYKHAFPFDLSGEITVTLRRLPFNATMNSIVLRVADNGVGMQPPARAISFGQTLVRNFAEHLKGDLVFAEREGLGTTATLTMQRPITDDLALEVDV